MRRRRMGGMNLNDLLRSSVGSVLYLPGIGDGGATLTDRSGNTIASANAKQTDTTFASGNNTDYAPSGLSLVVANNLNGARLKFDLRCAIAVTAYGKLYKNGVAWGTEQTDATTVWTTKSEDLTGLVAGDVITVWTKHTDGTGAWQVKDLSICYDYAPNNGTITGAVWKRDKSGLYYPDYDGVDDVTTVTDHASIQDIFNAPGGTVIVVINPRSDGEGDAGFIYSKSNPGNGTYAYVANELAGFVTLNFVCFYPVTAGIWNSTNRIIPINKLSVVAITYLNDNVANNPTFYFNGVPQDITESQTPVGVYLSDVGSNLRIGNIAAGNRTFDGGILMIEVIKGALWTDAQVKSRSQQWMRALGV